MRLRSFQRALTRSSVVVGTAATALVVVGAPAHAFPSLNISITYFATYHYVCADGTGPSGTLWEFGIAGTRSDVTRPIIDVIFPIATGSTYHQCYPVQKYGTAVGNYTAVLVSVSGTSDIPSAALGDGTWIGGQDQHITAGG